jgi:D-alanyl-D-alanine carboxypeptidase/D-alanyl-D-alanine-endopeptidase (penicillin-binding protein 4)
LALPATSESAAAPSPAATSAPRAASRREAVAFSTAFRGISGGAIAYVAPLSEPEERWTGFGDDGSSLGTPASTLKLLTAVAVLDSFSSTDRLVTSTVFDPESDRVVLVGGGDATLTTARSRGTDAASLSELAKKTARRLRRTGVSDVHVGYDSSLFAGPTSSPHWEPTYVTSGVIAPVTALMTDGGRLDIDSEARAAEPDLLAAQRFASLLSDEGVNVHQDPKPASSDGLDPVAEVSSAVVPDMVEQMLRDSDNQVAESLGRLAALRSGQPGSFDGASNAIVTAARARDIEMQNAKVFDASGLSRDDRLDPQMLVETLHAAATDPALAPILTGLPVSGFDGTLSDRYQKAPASRAAGLVRAKTGTLSGVSAEAGLVTTCDGVVLAFAVIIDDVVDTEEAQADLDRAAASLAACRQ